MAGDLDNDQVLSIGAFSLVSGLSITALRHYDAVGLLTPEPGLIIDYQLPEPADA